MNLGGNFSLKLIRSEEEVVVFGFYPSCFFAHPRGCTLSSFHFHSRQYPECYSRGFRSDICFGCFCRKRISQLRFFLGIVKNIVNLLMEEFFFLSRLRFQ